MSKEDPSDIKSPETIFSLDLPNPQASAAADDLHLPAARAAADDTVCAADKESDRCCELRTPKSELEQSRFSNEICTLETSFPDNPPPYDSLSFGPPILAILSELEEKRKKGRHRSRPQSTDYSTLPSRFGGSRKASGSRHGSCTLEDVQELREYWQPRPPYFRVPSAPPEEEATSTPDVVPKVAYKEKYNKEFKEAKNLSIQELGTLLPTIKEDDVAKKDANFIADDAKKEEKCIYWRPRYLLFLVFIFVAVAIIVVAYISWKTMRGR
ncbi:uncharacterized protein LOC106165746 [Lingula anatina]|uniref:Uncharacterized protein LOC106165746 n=1 Tax=Lingula anatina TaxID=7574 RepID=A0A1S3IMV4_LINAN|nr:uncharacterized protein LOC106165746 [Lingula anatina]XP_013399530.1 uncharacterized protein LOC106165746 [Lingula anatina]XP_013399531.1 uncharacterized protein LOC106165746 [Lingula anatina]XP_013399532.1 uncharacterized protein LOC106165746 [Lingula anatina]|eukprot:XP_013399529.1 uncharacterized protein LOC106165746 [Lingula anatina]